VCWQCGAAADAAAVEVCVPVPRCRACRTRNRAAPILAVVAAALGAGPHGNPPPWLLEGKPLDRVMPGLGMAPGPALVAIGLALRRQSAGRHTLETYSPVAALLRRGWRWPGD
jgi:hypothetical protein